MDKYLRDRTPPLVDDASLSSTESYGPSGTISTDSSFAKDYEHDSLSEIQISKNIFSGGVSTTAKSNSYIELGHDIHQQTAYNLTQFMIDTLKQRGYKAVTVGECLGDPPENWYVDASGTTGGSSSSR